MPKAMRSEGHPWEQVPSGSTMQPSVQQAGDVPSNIAWRAYAKAPSSEGSQPSFSSASMALIRYGLRVAVGTCVVFMFSCKGINCPQNPPLPMDSPGNSSLGFDEMSLPGPVGRNPHRLDSVA